MPALVVGPNPALQRVLRFDALELGGVNRASGLDQYVGGKGQGAALALQLWAPEEAHAVAQFLGGESGRYVESALGAAGLSTITQQVGGPTRTCTTLLQGGTSTELIDPSDPVTEAELAGLTERCIAAMGAYGVVALCGTQPPGAECLYERLAFALAEPDRPLTPADRTAPLLLLDGFKAVDGVLDSGRLDVLKLNLDELVALTKLNTPAAAARHLLAGPAARLRRPGAVVAITDGPRPALLFQARRPTQYVSSQCSVVPHASKGRCRKHTACTPHAPTACTPHARRMHPPHAHRVHAACTHRMHTACTMHLRRRRPGV